MIHYDKSKICPVCQKEFYWDDAKVSAGTFTGQVTCSKPCRRQRENVQRRRDDWIPAGPLPDPSPDWDYRNNTVRDWRHRAICRDEDPELFFAVGETGPARQQNDEAKTVCRRCPVVAECLTWALEAGEGAGVWGGMTEPERRSLKRRQQRTVGARA